VFNFTFPKIIEFMSEIDCNQFISSNSDWNWRYPNSYFDRPFISAFSPRTRKPEPGMRFFRRIAAYEVQGQDIQDAYDNIFIKLKNFPEKQLPKRLIRMDTVNDIKDETHIWFGFSSEDKGWAVVCAPECAPEYLFIIEKSRPRHFFRTGHLLEFLECTYSICEDQTQALLSGSVYQS
jgi:hypothetical protein